MAALSPSERRQTYPLLIVYGVLGPIELVRSGVTEALLSPHTRANDPEAVVLVRDNLRHANRRMLRNAVRSISLGREDLTALLPRIEAPTLMITGSDHAGFTPTQAEAAARLSPKLPDRGRAQRRLPGAARGAHHHLNPDPRVLGTLHRQPVLNLTTGSVGP